MRDRHDLGALGDHLAGGVGADAPVLGQVEPLERGPGAVRQLLERQQHRMVLGLGDHDLVAGLQREALGGLSPAAEARIAEGGGEQVQAGGRTGGHHDLLLAFRGVGADQSRNLGARILESRGRARRQLMRPTVHAGVDRAVELGFRIDHALRLLRGRRGVQIHERMPVYLLIQNRELRPNRRKINHCFP